MKDIEHMNVEDITPVIDLPPQQKNQANQQNLSKFAYCHQPEINKQS